MQSRFAFSTKMPPLKRVSALAGGRKLVHQPQVEKASHGWNEGNGSRAAPEAAAECGACQGQAASCVFERSLVGEIDTILSKWDPLQPPE